MKNNHPIYRYTSYERVHGVGQMIFFHTHLFTPAYNCRRVFSVFAVIFKRLRYAHDIVCGGAAIDCVVCGDVPFRKYVGKTAFDGYIRMTTPSATGSHYIEVIIL